MSGDYVSRDYLLGEYDRQHQGPPGGARKIIAEAPAADVVEVVRCSECRKGKWDPWTGAIWCEGRNRRPEFYCFYGERKNGGQDE